MFPTLLVVVLMSNLLAVTFAGSESTCVCNKFCIQGYRCACKGRQAVCVPACDCKHKSCKPGFECACKASKPTCVAKPSPPPAACLPSGATCHTLPGNASCCAADNLTCCLGPLHYPVQTVGTCGQICPL